MYDRILLPVAGDETDAAVAAATERASDLAAQYGAELVILSVVDSGVVDVLGERNALFEDVRGDGESRAAATVEAVADRVGPDVQVRPVVGRGTPHRRIVEEADDHDCDLIVMATHGRSGVAHGVLGSVTERVLRTAQTPVLAVPWEG
ncbi:MAG: universal stress protein [Haloferacaceae archaeon]